MAFVNKARSPFSHNLAEFCGNRIAPNRPLQNTVTTTLSRRVPPFHNGKGAAPVHELALE